MPCAEFAAGGRNTCPARATPAEGTLVSRGRYRKPPWMQLHVGNRLAPLFRPSLVWKLSVPGRRTGRWHTVPLVVLDHDGERYLVSIRGDSDWALDLTASRTGQLTRRGHSEVIT